MAWKGNQTWAMINDDECDLDEKLKWAEIHVNEIQINAYRGILM